MYVPQRTLLLRLVTALLVEISEQWETGKIYLSMEPPQADVRWFYEKKLCGLKFVSVEVRSKGESLVPRRGHVVSGCFGGG